MKRLSWGQYILIDDTIYHYWDYSPDNNRIWVYTAIDPTAAPQRQEVPAGSPGYKYISPSATYRGKRITELRFNDDDTVEFILNYRTSTLCAPWPDLERMEMWEDGGRDTGRWWYGTAPLSELEDIDDDIPDDWRPYLPEGYAGRTP